LEGDSREEVSMFNELPVSGPSRPPTRTRWTFLLSLAGEVTVVAVLLLIPLIHTEALPFHWLNTAILPSPPPPAPKLHVITGVTVVRGENKFSVPTAIPHHARVIPDTGPAAQPNALDFKGGIPGGTGTVPNSLFSGTGNPPSPPPVVAKPPSRIIRGGDVQAAQLIHFVRPIYPTIARSARVQGTVVLAAIIGTDGSVKALHPVSGSGLLIPAAIDAVAQWRYRPTFLNGRPVEVQTTISVIFTLEQ
jgi:protein TonB